jgi:chemotaxis protein methyltransferase WspC
MAPADFEGLLKASMGLNAASIGASAIGRAVQERTAACNLGDPAAYWEHVRRSDSELQALIEAVVVPETWFFRDRESFSALARLVRDEWLLDSRDRMVNLLSLPCSTGEEPYSMAMALLDGSIPADRFRIDAVDISTRALAQAERGVYGRNSFRDRDVAFRDRHFEATEHGYRLNDTVRRQVHFQQGNLFAPGLLPGAERYDVIFCRNVLIYFDRATQDRALTVLKRLLKAKGALFVAPAETALPVSHDFVAMNLPLAFSFRRTAASPSRPKRTIAPVEAPPRTRPGIPVRARHTLRGLAPATASRKSLQAEETPDLSEATRLADQGHFAEAATSCEEYLRRNGSSGQAFYLMGLVRDATGNSAEAVNFYRKCLYLEPDHSEAQIHLALLMERLGDAAGAQVLRNRARRLERRTRSAHE